MLARTRVNFYVDDALLAGLKALKARVGIPESEAVRRAIAEYLKKEGQEVSQQPERRRAVTRRRS